MGLMHNLFRKIDENVGRRRISRKRSHSESLTNAETLERRIALTANVYDLTNSGDSPGFLSFMLNESGDDLYIRQAVEEVGLGSSTIPSLQYSDNPDFSSYQQQPFSTNNISAGNSTYQDVFVGQGVANQQSSVGVVGRGPVIVLQDADHFLGNLRDGVAAPLLPSGLSADETFHVFPGTLGGNADFGLSFIRITNGNGVVEAFSVDTLNLLDEQDGNIDGSIPLVFGTGETQTIRLNFLSDVDVDVTGSLNPYTGALSLRLVPVGSPADDPYTTDFFISYGSPVVADQPSTFSLASGFTLDAGLIVDLPSVDSTILIRNEIASPDRGATDVGLVDLRATNVLVENPVEADEGFRVLESRFHNSANAIVNIEADVVASNQVNITQLAPVTPDNQVVLGSQVFAGQIFGARVDEVIPPDTHVIGLEPDLANPGQTILTLSNVVSSVQGRALRFYNPTTSPQYQVDTSNPDNEPLLTGSSTIFLELQAPDSNYDIQPGAVVLDMADPATGLVPPNTFVAAVDTVTGRVDLTRAIVLPNGVTDLGFFNPGYDSTTVENFSATAGIQSNDFSFAIANDITSDVRDRGRLYVAGSSSLTDVGGGNAALLSVNTSVSDIIFEGQVAAANQSYFFETSIAEAPYTFTTKNSSGVSTGSINGGTAAVMLSNLTEADPANSVIQDVDIDTAITSLRISAGFDEQLNPPYVDDDPIGSFPFAITVREADDLSLDAALSSGGPVDFTVGGDLALTASIQSQNDLSFTSSGTMTGTAWLTTANGSIDVEATDVNISGLTQVLTAPFDPTTTDVTVTATNGSVQLGQGIRAVNKVVIDQRTVAAPAGVGSVSSNGLLAASDVRIFAQGDVNVDTASPNVNVSVAGRITNGQGQSVSNTPRVVTVDSAVPASFELSSAGGTVNVSALGEDPVLPVPDPLNPGSFIGGVGALTLSLRDTEVLFATAPQGSIDVTAVTSQELVMGVAADLLTGQAANMQAAGSVSIRTTQAPVTVLDAAIAGQGALQVRAAAVVGTTATNLPGTYAQNTPGITPATITGDPANPQNINVFNTDTSNPGTPVFGGITLTNPLRFRDLVLLTGQTNAEENGVYQVINLGNQSEPWQLRRYGLADTTAELPARSRIYVRDGDAVGQTYKVDSYTVTPAAGTTPLLVTQGYERAADEIAVRFATETILDGTYNPGAGTITANPANLSGFNVNETLVNVGELILVQFGAELDGAGNNTPSSAAANGVYEVTAAGNAWQLTRYENPEPPAVPPATITTFEATVVVLEGFYRTSRSGETFTVAFDGMGLVPLVISQDDSVSSEIGSYDTRDATTLVVSTAAGTNDAAGSFGKMLTLAQDNAAEDMVGTALVQELRFGNELGSVTGVTGTIVLQQELPKIEKPITIDASSRESLSDNSALTLVVDGSRITSSSEGTFVTRADEVNGLELTSGASADLSNIFRPLASTVSSLRFGGFRQGAAIYVNGASNVLLDNLTIGQNENGDTQAVRYGVRVDNTSGSTGPVAIVGGQITSAMITNNAALDGDSTVPNGVTPVLDGAGVLLEDSASNVQIVGTQIGSQTAGNLVGVVSRSSNTSAAVNSIGVNPIGDFTTEARLNSRELVIPATDSSGAAINIRDAYVGLTIRASVDFIDGNGAATPNAEIVAVDPVTRKITLNLPLAGSDTEASITPNPNNSSNRTQIGQNFWGVLLESGSTRIVNTDITNNVYDGVFIGDGVNNAVFALIGESDEADATSNAIFLNGRNGIRFASNLTSSNDGITDITIQGNYIGRSSTDTRFVGNGEGSYFWEGNPGLNNTFRSFGYDPVTNTPTPPAYITGDDLFRALITPEISGGDVDENGNVNADFVAGSTGGGTSTPIGPPPPSGGNT